MESKERTVVVTMVVALLTAGGAMSQVLGPDAMMKGIEFTRASSLVPYNSSGAYQSLDSLRATGANWVTIVPVWWMTDTGRSAIYSRPDSSPSDAELEDVIGRAHSLGMQVFLKPEIRCSTGVWIGRHKPHCASWFNYYRVFIMHYAQLAQETECELFSVGSELDSTALDSLERVQWTQIINWVKGEYLGPVTYAADWRTYRDVPFWGSLDIIGINAYFPLWSDVAPDPGPPSWPVGYLSWWWDSEWIPDIETFIAAFDNPPKSVIFTEIGYRSISSCSHEPWNGSVSGTYSSADQRDCYVAALHSLLGKPWFAGWFWHGWTTDPNQGGAGDLSYSPKGKQSQEVLRRWSASIGSERGACFPTYDSATYGYDGARKALDSLAASHANWVGISCRWFTDSIGASHDTVVPQPASTPSDASIRTAIGWAHEAGLSVCLKAYLGSWNGHQCTDSEPVQWFQGESLYVRHCAEIAEEEGCEMLSVGAEINKTTDDRSEPEWWRDKIIAGAREAYFGPLTYAAHSCFLEPDNSDTVGTRFWDALDFAGIDWYSQLYPSGQYSGHYPLDTLGGQTPSVSDLLWNEYGTGWQNTWIPKLESLYGVIQKPIVFQEIGYQSTDSTAAHPGTGNHNGWQVQNLDTSYNLYSVCFPVDTMTGYVVGDGGKILKTTNSGSTWGTCNSGTSLALHSVDFPVTDTGYAVGQDGTILKTTNGWASHENRAELGVLVSYHSVCFPENPDVGFVVGDGGVILKTTNGGGSWTRLYCVDEGETIRVALRSISFEPNGVQSLVGYIVGDGGTVLRSTNGGSTWQVRTTPVTVNLNAVSLVSPDTCFVAGDSNHLLLTTNGGETWADSVFLPGQGTWDLRAVSVPDFHSARFVVGDAGALLRAGDGWPFGGSRQWPVTWANMRGVQFKAIQHGEGENGYVEYVGFSVGDGGTILKAPHGGRMIVDFNEQVNCYEAAFRSFWGNRLHPNPLPWFYGMQWWFWVTDPAPMSVLHETYINDHTPQQKPAEQVLRQWFDWTALQPHDTLAWMARHYPTGGLDLVMPASDKVSEPLVLCRLTCQNSDHSGPADSARLLQEYFGLGDTLIAADTTAWFSFVDDTTWQFKNGSGRYRFYVQYMEAPHEVSPPYADSVDTVIVFDTAPPIGSIVVEGGRFASNSTCILRLAASDSASGVCDMRFMNRPRVNLTRNGAFDPTGGAWSFAGSGSGYDTSLQMGRLSVGPTQAVVRQFVPAESISAYAGDSCVLEASILAHVHDGEATGEVSFWHFSTNENPAVTDTLWELVDSASYSGDLLSLTGRYNLSTRFLLATPAPESGWAWQGGMVRVRAQGVDGGTGSVWCDNAQMNCYEPQASGYAWYGPFETLAEWDIGSSAGQHVVGMCLRDSAGAENTTPYADTVILDATTPVVEVSLPMMGQLVNGSAVQVTGWAFDPIEIAGDTWFSRRTLSFRHADSTNWLPVSPDSTSLDPAYPDSMASQGPAVHLGYWNTLGLDDGTYYLLLTASDSAGNTSSCTTWVMVDQGFGGGDMCSGPEGGGSGLGEGSVFVGSSTGTVLHLSEELDSLDAFSVNDSGSQANITAIVEVGEDSILVLDAHNKRVHKLHRSGQHRRRLVSGLSQPADLKRDSSGNFWLVDRGWNRIGKFRSNGTLVFVRGGLGADSLHFHSPEGIAIKGGLVYVADAGNNRVAVWDTSGHFKTTITGDFENPTAVWVTESGAIYLTDGTDGKLKGITPLGGNIVTIGTTDSSKLKGLVPSENRHNLFSLASEPNKVYKLRIQSDESRPGGAQSGGRVNLPKTLALNQPFPNPARTSLNIAYALPRQTRVELKLYDVAGKLVTTLANGEQKPGYYNVTWNRQDTKGRSCACGVYFCTLAAENKRFSRKVILTE